MLPLLSHVYRPSPVTAIIDKTLNFVRCKISYSTEKEDARKDEEEFVYRFFLPKNGGARLCEIEINSYAHLTLKSLRVSYFFFMGFAF